MKLLITGACGFVGTTVAEELVRTRSDIEIIGIDNLMRAGSERNRLRLRELGVKCVHGDLRSPSDIEALPGVDWVIDAAANPSALAGVDGHGSSRQLMEHNLLVTVNVVEFCKRHGAGLVLLSTSRVYSIAPLAKLPVVVCDSAYQLDPTAQLPVGVTVDGVSESFSRSPPVSLYGAAKAASETVALEYGSAFDFPVWINRCGVLAGAGQFGRPDQGIFSFWINSYLRGRPLKYIGFDGQGHQVRDCLHPRDLVPLLNKQFESPTVPDGDRIVNLSGGSKSAISLRQLSDWCAERFGPRSVESDLRPRKFDIPWMVLDHGKASRLWNWYPRSANEGILEEIASHAERHPEWLDLSLP